jgi:hypothetical protein
MRRPETPKVLKGRGTTAQPANRFAKERVEAVDDGWDSSAADGGVPWETVSGGPAWFNPDGEAPATGFIRSPASPAPEATRNVRRSIRGG